MIAGGLILILLAVLFWVVGTLLVLRWTWRRLRGPRSYVRHDRAIAIAQSPRDALRGTSSARRGAHKTRWLRPETYVDAPEYLDRRDPDA